MRENRLPSGVRIPNIYIKVWFSEIPPVNSRELGVPEASSCTSLRQAQRQGVSRNKARVAEAARGIFQFENVFISSEMHNLRRRFSMPQLSIERFVRTGN